MKNSILQCFSLDYRFKIIKYISDKKEVTVNDIVCEVESLGIQQSIVSQTLKLFRNNGLVDFRCHRQTHIYFIKNKHVTELLEIIEKLMKESKENGIA